MLCQGPPVMFDLFLGLQAPSGVRRGRASTGVLCQVWPTSPADLAVRIPRKKENWFSDCGSGRLQSPGARRNCIRCYPTAPEGAQSTQWSTTCRQEAHTLWQAGAGQKPNRARHRRPCPLHVRRITGHAYTSSEHHSCAKCRLFTCFRPQTDHGACRRWRNKIDLACRWLSVPYTECRQRFVRAKTWG